jgi:hypothetical protein
MHFLTTPLRSMCVRARVCVCACMCLCLASHLLCFSSTRHPGSAVGVRPLSCVQGRTHGHSKPHRCRVQGTVLTGVRLLAGKRAIARTTTLPITPYCRLRTPLKPPPSSSKSSPGRKLPAEHRAGPQWAVGPQCGPNPAQHDRVVLLQRGGHPQHVRHVSLRLLP